MLGSEAFLKKIKRQLVNPHHPDEVPAAKRLASLDPSEVISTVAAYYDQSPEDYAHRRSAAPGRDLAAYLTHHRTTATLRSLASLFGLSHPDSVSNLVRRAERALSKSSQLKKDGAEIERLLLLLKIENRV